MLHRSSSRICSLAPIVAFSALLYTLRSCAQSTKKPQQAEVSKLPPEIPCERDTFGIYNDNISFPGIRETLNDRMAGHWQGRDSVLVYEEIWHTDSIIRKAKWFILDKAGKRICLDIFVYDIHSEF